MIAFFINAQNVEESNLFLRKLWCELSTICPMAWQFQPVKKNNKVSIGYCNLGEVLFDYKMAGCIKNLYIDNKSEDKVDEITAAVRRAQEGKFKIFNIKLIFENNRKRVIANSNCADLSIAVDKGENALITNIFAYSVADVKQWVQMKIWTLRAILYEYTFQIFDLKAIVCAERPTLNKNMGDAQDDAYDRNWVDCSDIPIADNGAIIVPQECLSLLSIVLKGDQHAADLDLLLNSARMLFTSQQIESGLQFPNEPGISDIINSTMISSIEPLASFIDRRVMRCDCCGNPRYSVVAKIRTLLSKYVSLDFAKYFTKQFYSMRSSLFHEGKMISNLTKSNACYPLIDPLNTKEMLIPTGIVLMNLKEYSSYVFRKMIHEYYTVGIDVIEADDSVRKIQFF